MPRRTRTNRELGGFTPGYRRKWADPEWQLGLTRLEKALWQQLSEQPTMSHAGVLQVDCDTLAEQHPDCSPHDIERDLAGLQSKGYIRREGQWLHLIGWFANNPSMNNPNHLLPTLRAIDTIGRRQLRLDVSTELLNYYAGEAPTANLSAAIITALRDHATKWQLHLPDELQRPIRAVRADDRRQKRA